MSYDILFNQALKLHEAGNLDEAERIYRQILDTTPKNADILNLIGLIAQSKGIHKEAINFFYEAIKETPNFAPLYFNLGLSLEADKKPIEAIEAYEKSIQLDPKLKEAYNNIGRITNKAEYYKKALEINPNYNEAKANLALLNNDIETLKSFDDPHSLYYLSKITSGKEALEYAAKADNLIENDEIKSRLGALLLAAKDFNKARQVLEKAIEINKKNVSALVNLANIESNLENYRRAEELYKNALDIEPNNLDAHINYGNLLYQEKRLSESLEEYRKAIIINPAIPEVSNNLAIILKDMEEYEEALGLFFNAFFRKPELEETSINIFETLQLLSQIDTKSLKKAQKIAKNWQKEAKNNIFAKNIANILEGKAIENNQVFYKKYFEHFADDFDDILKNISYFTPRSIRDITGIIKGTIVDLGCGSGLVGAEIKTEKNKIIGVDISPKMLEKAREKGIYDELIESDILSYNLNEHPALIVAADVFCYFGDLEPIFSKYAGNNLCFSIETHLEEKDYTLQTNGRYSHNHLYVEKLLQRHGFKHIEQHPLILRKENDEEVKGIIFIAKGEPNG